MERLLGKPAQKKRLGRIRRRWNIVLKYISKKCDGKARTELITIRKNERLL
jgi:hypothetical protein